MRSSAGSSDRAPWSAADHMCPAPDAAPPHHESVAAPCTREEASLSCGQPGMIKLGMCAGVGGRVAPGATRNPANLRDGHMQGETSVSDKMATSISCARPQAANRRQHVRRWCTAAEAMCICGWAGSCEAPGSVTDHSHGALSDRLEAHSELLLLARMELAAA